MHVNKPGCPMPCTHDYHPVCGTDGETFKVFGNECSLRASHCDDDKGMHLKRINYS